MMVSINWVPSDEEEDTSKTETVVSMDSSEASSLEEDPI